MHRILLCALTSTIVSAEGSSRLHNALFRGLRNLRALNTASSPTPDEDSSRRNFSTIHEHWMSDLIGDDLSTSQFANMTLHDIYLPGTHDSGAYNLTAEPAVTNTFRSEFEALIDLTDRLGLSVGNAIRPWGEAQTITITEQLRHGIRFLDMRPGWHNDSQSWRTFHGNWGEPIVDQFRDVKRFLDTHPREVVFLQNFYMFNTDPTEEQLKKLAQIIEEVFGAYLLPKERGLDTTLKTMIETGHRLQVFFYDDTFSVGRDSPLLHEGYRAMDGQHASGEDVDDVLGWAKRSVFEDTLRVHEDNPKITKISFVGAPQLKTLFESILPEKPKSLHDIARLVNAGLPEFKAFLDKNGYRFGSIMEVDYVDETDLVAMCVEWNSRLLER